MDLVNLSLGTGAGIGLLGYAVVFFGLILLMLVMMIMSSFFISKAKKEAAEAAAAPAEVVKAAPVVEKEKAKGTAGEVALYDTDPKDAAMIMAIVADKMGKPLNELRFKSIKEVK